MSPPAPPEIIVNDRQLRDIIDDARAAIGAIQTDTPNLFSRDGVLARLVDHETGAAVESWPVAVEMEEHYPGRVYRRDAVDLILDQASAGAGRVDLK